MSSDPPLTGTADTLPPSRLPSKAGQRLLSLHDFEPWARARLPRPIFGYIEGGVEDQFSRSENRQVFSEYLFKPRALRDVSRRSQQVELLGERYACPFGIAPMGITAMTAYRGDLQMARAAEETGVLNVLSAFSLIPMEAVVRASPRTWYQAYLPGDPDKIGPLVERVRQAGFKTLVLTVDTPVIANRENNVRTGFATPLRPTARLLWDGLVRPRWTLGTFLRTLVRHGMPRLENMLAERGMPIMSASVVRGATGRDGFTWQHVDAIRRQWPGHLVIKGLLSVEDARLARDHGADAIVLSNHGGRQLDGAMSPMRVLPAVVAAMGSDFPVLIDSGFRRGTDVLKAVALGARMVLIGRPFNFALTAGGAAGVRHAIDLLRQEVDRDLGQLGCSDIGQVTAELLHPIGSPVAAGPRWAP